MRLLPREAAYQQRVKFGLYVARALLLVGLPEMARATLAITLAVKTAGRAWEDADQEAFSASADRDVADAGVDRTAQNGRAKLAGRSATANRERPYVSIFPDGIAWYISASLAEQIDRYTTLINRLLTHLPEGDEVRDLAPIIEAGLAAFKAGQATLADARQKLDGARTALTIQEEDFDRAMTSLYGRLLEHFGNKAEAEAVFPRM